MRLAGRPGCPRVRDGRHAHVRGLGTPRPLFVARPLSIVERDRRRVRRVLRRRIAELLCASRTATIDARACTSRPTHRIPQASRHSPRLRPRVEAVILGANNTPALSAGGADLVRRNGGRTSIVSIPIVRFAASRACKRSSATCAVPRKEGRPPRPKMHVLRPKHADVPVDVQVFRFAGK